MGGFSGDLGTAQGQWVLCQVLGKLCLGLVARHSTSFLALFGQLLSLAIVSLLLGPFVLKEDLVQVKGW